MTFGNFADMNSQWGEWRWGKSCFVGEQKKKECQCMSIPVARPNSEVELTPIKSADIAL